MKKLITLALVLTMLLLTLVACNNGNDVNTDDDSTATPPQRVELPEWPDNPNTIEIPEDALVNRLNFIPVLSSSIETLKWYINLYSESSRSHIFRGIVLYDQIVWRQRHPDPPPDHPGSIHTETTFLIKEVFFGDFAPGETVAIIQPGGVYNGVRVMATFNDLRVDLPIGEEFIVFAWQLPYPYSDIFYPLWHHQAFHWLGNPYGGRALSAMSDTSVMEAGYVEIVPSPQNVESWMETLVITREFLAEIAEAGGHEIGAPIPVDVMAQAQVVHEQVAAARAEREAEAMREQQVAE
ncbi:MAG: hypothetical protein FWB93_03790 [Oscillospiraceae bacterium]|nr:hypothetical protein [Oscillospiraceae bacterium]